MFRGLVKLIALSVAAISCCLPVFGGQLPPSSCGVRAVGTGVSSIQADLDESQRLWSLKVQFRNGDHDWLRAMRFSDQLIQLPPEPRKNWVKTIAHHMRAFPKTGRQPGIAGRRLLQMIANRTQDLSQAFVNVSSDDDAKLVFRRIYNEQAQLFQSDFIVSGSFVNGSARADSSDLDSIALDARAFLRAKDWEADLEIVLSKKGKKMIPIDWLFKTSDSCGTTSTFVVEIRTEGVFLLVFPPAQIDPQNPKKLTAGPSRGFRIL